MDSPADLQGQLILRASLRTLYRLPCPDLLRTLCFGRRTDQPGAGQRLRHSEDQMRQTGRVKDANEAVGFGPEGKGQETTGKRDDWERDQELKWTVTME